MIPQNVDPVTDQKVGFDAFISYANKADLRTARRVESFLEGFHAALGQPGVRKLEICRDRSDFRLPLEDAPSDETTKTAWDTIVTNLNRARYLIVLCSPAATQSVWVGREIEFIRKNRGDRWILPAVTEGTDPRNNPSECFPEELRRSNAHESRIWYDFRGRDTDPETFEDELVRLAEDLLELDSAGTGTLAPAWKREKKRIQRRRRLAVAVVSVLLFAVVGIAAVQVYRRRNLEKQQIEQVHEASRNDHRRALQLFGEENYSLGLAHLAHSLSLWPANEEAATEAWVFLRYKECANLLLPEKIFRFDNEAEHLIWSPDGKYLVLYDSFDGINVLDASNGKVVVQVESWSFSPQAAPKFLGDRNEMLLSGESEWMIIPLEKPEQQKTFRHQLNGLADPFSPDGKWILSQRRPASLVLSDVHDGREMAVSAYGPDRIGNVSLADSEQVTPLAGYFSQPAIPMAWHPSGTRVVIATQKNLVVGFEIPSLKPDPVGYEFKHPIKKLTYTAAGDWLEIVENLPVIDDGVLPLERAEHYVKAAPPNGDSASVPDATKSTHSPRKQANTSQLAKPPTEAEIDSARKTFEAEREKRDGWVESPTKLPADAIIADNPATGFVATLLPVGITVYSRRPTSSGQWRPPRSNFVPPKPLANPQGTWEATFGLKRPGGSPPWWVRLTRLTGPEPRWTTLLTTFDGEEASWSADGAQLLLREDGSVSRIRWDPAVSVHAGVERFLEILGGQRIDENGSVIPVAEEERLAWRSRLPRWKDENAAWGYVLKWWEHGRRAGEVESQK
jgi:hypothetical protein